jgi:hypothetical protein
MPVVLSQRTWHEDPKYLHREGVIYHYAPQYRTRVIAYERFIYYRPATGADREEASSYFGHGVLGAPFKDPHREAHWYVPIAWYERFLRPVPLLEPEGWFYETEAMRKPQFQSAVRAITETAYYRLLAMGGVSAFRKSVPLLTTENVGSYGFRSAMEAPKDSFRIVISIPEGTGYVPSGSALPSVYESAALQERAREDHQATLELIRSAVERSGGSCWYNNNVDLFARVGERRFLIEAKSLNDPTTAVDRMRYGMGQLFDYRVRYRAELEDAEPVLAFGAPPAFELAWIATILQENAVRFVANVGERIAALNRLGEDIPFASAL